LDIWEAIEENWAWREGIIGHEEEELLAALLLLRDDNGAVWCGCDEVMGGGGVGDR